MEYTSDVYLLAPRLTRSITYSTDCADNDETPPPATPYPRQKLWNVIHPCTTAHRTNTFYSGSADTAFRVQESDPRPVRIVIRKSDIARCRLREHSAETAVKIHVEVSIAHQRTSPSSSDRNAISCPAPGRGQKVWTLQLSAFPFQHLPRTTERRAPCAQARFESIRVVRGDHEPPKPLLAL